MKAGRRATERQSNSRKSERETRGQRPGTRRVSPKRGARAVGGRLGLKLGLVFSVNDGGAGKSSRREFSVLEGRVPRSWSLERRREALATKLRRRMRVARVAEMMSVLGSVHRLGILGALAGGAATYRQLVKATKLQAGPLYHHVNQLRFAGLVRPKERDLYEITARGREYLLIAAAVGNRP